MSFISCGRWKCHSLVKFESWRMKPTVWSASSRQAKLCTVRTALRHWRGERRKSGQWELNHKTPIPSSSRKSWGCRGSALRDRECIHESGCTGHGSESENFIFLVRGQCTSHSVKWRESCFSREHAYERDSSAHLHWHNPLFADSKGDWILTTAFSLSEQGWAEATSKNSSHSFLSRTARHKVSSHPTPTSATVLSRPIKHP